VDIRINKGHTLKKSAKPRRAAPLKIIVERHSDSYVAYPLGLKGVVVGEGDTFEEALADVKSAVHFHIKTFGTDALEQESSLLDVFVAETEVRD
jgi:predicted RNase H-like HicB family nuclease